MVNAVKLYHDPSLLAGTPPFDCERALWRLLHRASEHQKPTLMPTRPNTRSKEMRKHPGQTAVSHSNRRDAVMEMCSEHVFYAIARRSAVLRVPSHAWLARSE